MVPDNGPDTIAATSKDPIQSQRWAQSAAQCVRGLDYSENAYAG